MRVLVTWGSKRGGTEGIARTEPVRGLLATLCLFAGLTAIAGGAALVGRPDSRGSSSSDAHRLRMRRPWSPGWC